MKSLLRPHITPYTKIRVGRIGDGGYIFLKEILDKSKFTYSYGISEEPSYDEQMAACGKTVLMYDHTINLPLIRYDHSIVEPNDKLIFHKQPFDRHFYNHLGPEQLKETDMCLKMDVEGAEWDGLHNCDERVFDHFSQIGCEFHWVDENNQDQKKVFERLLERYTIFHIHANNSGFYRHGRIPSVLEISFLRNDFLSINHLIFLFFKITIDTI
jgi:hypothetical protein